jgi:hypothetical protein
MVTGEHVRVPLTAGTPTVGLWCDTCLLPSRYRVAVFVMGVDGPRQVGTVDHCELCKVDTSGKDQP